jgi:hypothetical protein
MQKIKKLITELRKCKSLKDMRDASWLILRNGVYDFSWQDWCRQLSDEIYIAHEQDMADYAREMFPDSVPCDEFDIGRASVEAFQRECVRHDMVERLRDTTFACLNSFEVLSVLCEAIAGRESAQMAASDMGCKIRKALIEVLAKNEYESAPIEDACEDYEPLEGSITGELRSMVIDNPDCDDVYVIDKDDFDRACDAIDAVHANLEGCYESATKARVDAEITQYREICDALKNIKSLSGPYRSMVENYESVRASRDRWKAKVKKAERYANLMEQMLRDARDEFVQMSDSVQEKDVCGNTKVGSFNLGIMFDGDCHNKTLIGDLGTLAAYLAEQLGYRDSYAKCHARTESSNGEKL